MKNTAFWKQSLLSALIFAGAVSAWLFRAELYAILAPVTASQAQSVETRRDSAGKPVIVADVETKRDDLTFASIGTGFAQRSVTLRAPSAGEVTALFIAPGIKFEAGDTLLTLDDTDERLAVQLAEARLERARSERDRYRALQDTGVAATARFEQAQTDYKVARIALEQARADLADRSMRAPFDGVSGLASIEVGDRIAADEAISSFDDRGRILVEFDLPEALLSRVSVGLPVIVRSPSVEGRVFDGEVTAIDSRVEAETRTARVRAAVDNPADLLRPGASFSIGLDLPGKAYPAVPELALQFSRGTLQVWRVEGGVVQPVPVRLVRRRAGLVIVDGALSEGDRVVVEGTQRLRPGVSVEVLNSPEGAQS